VSAHVGSRASTRTASGAWRTGSRAYGLTADAMTVTRVSRTARKVWSVLAEVILAIIRFLFPWLRLWEGRAVTMEGLW
jgi:hypothetical protein